MTSGRASRISRDDILRTAEYLIETTPDHSFSLRKIASGLGCAAPSIYYHFRNRDDIIQALMLEKFREVNDYCSAGANILEHFRRFGEYWISHPGMFRILFLTDSVVVEESPAARYLFESNGLRVASLLPDPARAELLTTTIIMSLSGIIYGSSLSTGPGSSTAALNQFIDMLRLHLQRSHQVQLNSCSASATEEPHK